MSKPYLEITYRQGKPFAAYLYLDRRTGDRVVRSERHGTWLIDFASDGRAIGIEFTQVGQVDVSAVNQALAAHQQPLVQASDLMPLKAA
jgi:hypothetical protein